MRPYPIERLRRLRAEEARELTAWARSAPIGELARGGLEARGWLGAPIELAPLAPRPWDEEPPRSGAFALLLGPPRVGLWLDPAVAAALVERTLGGEEAPLPPAGPMGDVERGVLAYALGRWLGPCGWQVAAVLADGAPLVEALAPRARWPLQLSLGAARGLGELWLAGREGLRRAPRRPPPAWMPVEVRIDAGRATLPAAEVASLRVGDAVIPDELWIDAAGRGMVRVRAARSARTFVCRSGASLRVERVEEDARIARPAPPSRGRSPVSESMITKLGDTPVTLHLEVARLELTLEELAGLAVGEVLHTGLEVSREVSLRAGDRIVARGELVDIEGELGVQVRELTEALRGASR